MLLYGFPQPITKSISQSLKTTAYDFSICAANVSTKPLNLISLVESNLCFVSQSLTGNKGILQGLQSHLETSEVCEVGACLLQLFIRQNLLRNLGSSGFSCVTWRSAALPPSLTRSSGLARAARQSGSRLPSTLGLALAPPPLLGGRNYRPLVSFSVAVLCCCGSRYFSRDYYIRSKLPIKPKEEFHLGCSVPSKNKLSLKQLEKGKAN